MGKKTQYVVLQTNTNSEHAVFGPFKTEEEAEGFKYLMAGKDHLHAFDVHEIQSPQSEEEE